LIDEVKTCRSKKAAARNEESGKEAMNLLLDRRGQEAEITEKVVKAAAGNKESGKEVMGPRELPAGPDHRLCFSEPT
jgi:hypothetical protein